MAILGSSTSGVAAGGGLWSISMHFFQLGFKLLEIKLKCFNQSWYRVLPWVPRHTFGQIDNDVAENVVGPRTPHVLGISIRNEYPPKWKMRICRPF